MKLQAAACNFIKKETLAQVFSCGFCYIFKNTFFAEHLWATASAIRTVEYRILATKKTSVKTLQIGLHSVFSNVPIKHVQEKEKGKEI